eukprot:gnl/MRDRNA2_/MRDRNA2_27103_c0_seq1.p1 gnl/MRDRNA2_/MRDRNA2_27103_c0~~gnl/MRDRNA2_/MRDRNA2_27103_c0_seq1.p1  ORF type:complete len:231 (-),score=35.93 gnl/MRDRNA2_/MRDRNA2_27103_c0_seq1:111-803(-)
MGALTSQATGNAESLEERANQSSQGLKPSASARPSRLVTVIGISGPSRSGKSRLASALQERLGGAPWCETISQDAFWRSCQTRLVNGVEKVSEEERTCTDWKEFESAVSDLVSEQKANADRDSTRRMRYVIVEGFSLFYGKNAAAFFDLEFHINISREEVIARRSAVPSPDRPNPNPQSKQYCEEILWPAHIDYFESSVQDRHGLHYLEAGNEAAFARMVDDAWAKISEA